MSLALVLDARDLIRYAEYVNVDVDTLEYSVSNYLSKNYALPTTYKPPLPAPGRKYLSHDELDSYFMFVSLTDIGERILNNMDASDVVEVKLERGFLFITT